MEIDEIESVILLAGEYRVIASEFQALNSGDVAEIGVRCNLQLDSCLKISINDAKFAIRVEYFYCAHFFDLRLFLMNDDGGVRCRFGVHLPRSDALTNHAYVASLDIITLIIAEFLLDDIAQHNS